MKSKVKKTTIILTLFLLGFTLVPLVSEAATIRDKIGAEISAFFADKKCNFIDRGEYLPFSDINGEFPVFGKLMSGVGGCIDVTNSVNDMFAYGFQVFLGVVSLIAVVRVSIAGIQWMLQDTGSNAMGKSSAKQKLTNSIIGLVLALSSWLILNAVNPRILNVDLNFGAKGGLSELQGLINLGAEQANVYPVQDAGSGGESLSPGTVGKTNGATGVSTGGATGGSSSGGVANFTNQEWENYLRQKIEGSGLNNLSPSDAAKFFPDGKPTTDGWVRVFEEVIQRESGFKAGTVYSEPELGYDSIGLLQLSAVDTIVKNKGYTEEDLKDPYKNIDAGVDIFKFLVKRDGCISCGTQGGAAYWSVLRTSDVHENGKLDQIINAVNQ